MTTPPDSLPDDARALKELLIAARDENERLIAIIKVLQRHRFGPRSEKIDPDQLALMLEDVEQAIAAAEAEAEGKREPAGTPVRRKRQINRGALPKHLPREEVVVDLADKCCPCCNRLRVKLGEDVSERLDMIPARFKVIVTRRPKYTCRECDGEVAQAPAPEHLIEGGIPTEALIAAVVIAKYADHLPLYRQAQIYGRQGVELDRSTLADWSGRAAFALRPVYERLFDVLKGSDKLFADETRAPVLDPGRRKTKTGQLWAYARDDRPWGGPEPPGVAYVYEPDRKHERPAAHLAGFAGCLQVDGYGAYKALGACLLNPGEMGFEPLKPVGEPDAANLRIRFDVRVEALRPSFVAPFPRWRSSAGCECGQGRGPPLGELQDIVGEADEAPLVGDLLDAAQEKLTEAARLLDLSEHRLGQLLS